MERFGTAAKNNDEIDGRNLSLVTRLSAGDPTALQELADAYATELGVIAVSITNSYDLAQDVFQDVLIKVWEHREMLLSVENLTGFLRQLTRRRAIDLLRREQAQERMMEQVGSVQSIDVQQASNSAVQNLDAADFRRSVRAVLESVPPQSRRIFLLHYEGGLSYGEIAETLGIAPKTVRNQLYRALRVVVDRISQTKSE